MTLYHYTTIFPFVKYLSAAFVIIRVVIKALVIDIDGVIVGEKIGYNTPYPHPDVINRLAAIKNSGIPVVLCTAKPHYSITPIIESAKLTNPHITFAGGIVIDPLQNKIVESHPIPAALAQSVLNACIADNFYMELYTRDAYYVLKSQVSKLTEVHTHILQQPPVLVDSLEEIAQNQEIFKILPIVPDESGIQKVTDALTPFIDSIETTWSIHPIANPHQFCNIAPKNVSKRQATLNVLSHLGIDAKDTLSVGDSTSDWKFMELCGFVATLENGQQPLKELVNNKGNAGFIGGHVDTNGFLTIVDHFTVPTPPPPKSG